jgi:hypothetical protein
VAPGMRYAMSGPKLSLETLSKTNIVADHGQTRKGKDTKKAPCTVCKGRLPERWP